TGLVPPVVGLSRPLPEPSQGGVASRPPSRARRAYAFPRDESARPRLFSRRGPSSDNANSIARRGHFNKRKIRNWPPSSGIVPAAGAGTARGEGRLIEYHFRISPPACPGGIDREGPMIDATPATEPHLGDGAPPSLPFPVV